LGQNGNVKDVIGEIGETKKTQAFDYIKQLFKMN